MSSPPSSASVDARERVTQGRIERVALLGAVQGERQDSLVDRLEQGPLVNA